MPWSGSMALPNRSGKGGGGFSLPPNRSGPDPNPIHIRRIGTGTRAGELGPLWVSSPLGLPILTGVASYSEQGCEELRMALLTRFPIIELFCLLFSVMNDAITGVLINIVKMLLLLRWEVSEASLFFSCFSAICSERYGLQRYSFHYF